MVRVLYTPPFGGITHKYNIIISIYCERHLCNIIEFIYNRLL